MRVTWGCHSLSLLSHSVVSNEQKHKTSLESDLKTYPNISQAASDTGRRIFVSIKGCLSLIIILYIILLIILFGYECFRCFINHKTNLNSTRF
ncbi:hypothetical protein BRARA_F02232 [Brassica rapa]|uniref:Uncharacterized protein n=1 Tax=Brassica campestris TaxID=3711 RepID=A0A397YZW0_BRACM|nr:hypothetical protein BRARA_F02232 [Brassica rapa]